MRECSLIPAWVNRQGQQVDLTQLFVGIPTFNKPLYVSCAPGAGKSYTLQSLIRSDRNEKLRPHLLKTESQFRRFHSTLLTGNRSEP